MSMSDQPEKESGVRKDSNSMWGGRFESAPADLMTEINASIGVDCRLWRQDIAGSKAHCRMLARQKILSAEDGAAILAGLDRVTAEIEAGHFEFRTDLEDIHMNIEGRLKDLIGDVAGKLHTARSRNDQVATDFRLWVREACQTLVTKISACRTVFATCAQAHKDTVMPGYTHLQVAQPVTLAMHLEAYAEMLSRDSSRFEDCTSRHNFSPLGACALSGTGFPTDPEWTARELGFSGAMRNSMDAVSARDFATEFLFACAQCGVHLSRLAEEIVYWSSPHVGFVRLSDSWSTGSSIMPQKKNPDAAELVRAKTGRLNGNLVQLLTVMKALPLAYNKDMQEDKTAVFESFDTLCLCLDAMAGMIESAAFDSVRMYQATADGYATATEIADWLVRELDMPFREAHHVTGRIVRLAEGNAGGEAGGRKCALDALHLAALQEIEPRITDDLYSVLDPKAALRSRGVL